VSSQPQLPADVKSNFENILNNNTAQDITLKADLISDINKFYNDILKVYLNSERLLTADNFNYTYKGNNITYINLVENVTLSNVGFKGLTYRMLFDVLGA
jgi:hypothetical protein